jgi:hypothetical protein
MVCGCVLVAVGAVCLCCSDRERQLASQECRLSLAQKLLGGRWRLVESVGGQRRAAGRRLGSVWTRAPLLHSPLPPLTSATACSLTQPADVSCHLLHCAEGLLSALCLCVFYIALSVS